ncbi:S8 family serine peptidase [Micromonospora sp. NPDC048839]|uniref:S8 family serine peptidase n=1 Tax=Micromonospora sp. NPDC048839 TaxID=3155641 RepID=UPI003401B814
MTRTRDTDPRGATGWVAAILAVVVLVVGTPAAPARAAVDEYVLYYTVTSAYQGKPENLGEIAGRLLGNSSRSTEIFNLNTARRQPDGGALTDPNTLHAGWYLVVPWDAVGAGLQHGVLPNTAPAGAPAASAPAVPPQASTPQAPGVPAVPVVPGSPAAPAPPLGGTPPIPSLTPVPAQIPSTPPPPAPAGRCVAATAASAPSNWATVRLAADLAWPHTRGVGQLVAIVDSGVDGRAGQLAGRVSIGANIVTGDGRGDSDCLGTGTAMAGLVAAQPADGDVFAGVAPESVIMPVRVATDQPSADAAAQATAIEVAVSAGATVIALGSYVDVTAEGVSRAVEAALSRNIVVVAAAPVGPGAAAPPAELISVGGVGADGTLLEEYAADLVDVVAPGVNVSSIGINGTKQFVGSGTQYAVALVSGTVALVRAARPDLSAAQVAHRVRVTADKTGDAQPDARYGGGMINPEAAVTRELPEEATQVSTGRRPGQSTGGDGTRVAFLLTVLAGLVLSGLLVFRLRRSVRRAEMEPDTEDEDDGLDADWPAGTAPEEQPRQPTLTGTH